MKYRLQDMIHQAVLHDCLFGIAHIYIDMGADENEMRNPLFKDRAKVGDKFRGFRIIEPIWMYPAMYNTLRPWSRIFISLHRGLLWGRPSTPPDLLT